MGKTGKFCAFSPLCSSTSDISTSENSLGKEISPVASQKIILLISPIVFYYPLLGHVLHHDQQMVWFNCLLPFDDAKNKKTQTNLVSAFEFLFQVCHEFFFALLHFCIARDTSSLLCCTLASLESVCVSPKRLVIYVWTSGLFYSWQKIDLGLLIMRFL